MIAFDSIAQMLQDTEQSGLPLWENILESDCRRQDLPRARSLERMGAMLDAMVQADESYQAQDRSHSGLSGGDGAKMTLYAAGDPLCGPLLSQVMAGALRMGECNACMKRIVAAPTAGACGVLPAVLLPCARHFSLSREQLVQALYVASGFGMVIAARASISGAEGGCQAEIGSAAAMAAPALVHLRGGTPSMMAHACAMAVKNLLGLVCDPVGGLVEVPCVKRNVIGAMDALSAAQMALAGIESRVPPDQVLDAMAEVGRSLPPSLRETGKGGLAATPCGMAYAPKEGGYETAHTSLFLYTGIHRFSECLLTQFSLSPRSVRLHDHFLSVIRCILSDGQRNAFRLDKSESFLRRMGSLEKDPRSSVFAQWSALPHRFSSVVFSAVRPGSYFMYSNLWIFEHLFCQPDPSISGKCVISFSV